MNWDERVKEAAIHRGLNAVLLGPARARSEQKTAQRWARWQRDQLRSDDAVERVAQFMWSERAKGTVHPHYPWTGLAPQLRDGLRQDARAAINALLGEEK